MSALTATTIPPIAQEDAARASFYALLARLYASGPDAQILSSLAISPRWPEAPENALAAAWNALLAASAGADAATIEQEYTDLFVGVGKCEVNLHASHWVAGFMMEKPLAQLRTELALLGLARLPGGALLEDHLSALCETMRMLIAGDDDRAPASVAVQRSFFDQQLVPWAFDCCTAIANCPIANYYIRVSSFTGLFLAVERDSFVME